MQTDQGTNIHAGGNVKMGIHSIFHAPRCYFHVTRGDRCQIISCSSHYFEVKYARFLSKVHNNAIFISFLCPDTDHTAVHETERTFKPHTCEYFE